MIGIINVTGNCDWAMPKSASVVIENDGARQT